MTLFRLKVHPIHRPLQQICTVLCLALSLIAGGCGGGGSTHGGSDPSPSTEEGTLAVSLSDAATDEYKAVYVTIASVEVRSANSTTNADAWVTVADTSKTCNLLDLVNGTRVSLGQTSLKDGVYSQLRLVLGTAPVSGNNILDESHPYPHYTISSENNEIRELKVPDALSDGISIISGFAISAGEETDLVIDFDAARSIVRTRNTYHLLRPSLKSFEPAANGALSGNASTRGTPSEGVEGCYISAQERLGTQGGDDLIAPVAGTLTDSEGNYSLFLEPGDSYTMVAFKHGYQTQCFNVADPEAGKRVSRNFTLEQLTTASGSISGQVTIAGSAAEQRYATIQVRRNLACQNENGSISAQTAVVKSVNIAAGSSYALDLPPGVYQVLAFAPDAPALAPVSQQVSLNGGASLTRHIHLE